MQVTRTQQYVPNEVKVESIEEFLSNSLETSGFEGDEYEHIRMKTLIVTIGAALARAGVLSLDDLNTIASQDNLRVISISD